jgi:predicted AlkP superfamily pyrophosphatase or phosphodiesterase
MVTGLRIDRRQGGHGVDWNTDVRGTTVRRAAGRPVSSIFSVVHRAGLDSALFAAKSKFSLFKRSWPSIDRMTIRDGNDGALTRAVRADLVEHQRAFTFLHLGAADAAGHAHGFMSQGYLQSVRRTDARLGSILATIEGEDSLDDLVVVLTSDHGGRGRSHDDPTRLANYRVPFMVWGPGVAPDNLYDLNPTFANPGKRRVGFAARQPIRNGDVANLTASLLGLGPVPHSLWDRNQDLRVR